MSCLASYLARMRYGILQCCPSTDELKGIMVEGVRRTCWVPSLNHERLDISMEAGAVVVATGTQCQEIVGSLGDLQREAREYLPSLTTCHCHHSIGILPVAIHSVLPHSRSRDVPGTQYVSPVSPSLHITI